ncbi:nitrogenase component 1 [Methanolacinia petrolearia]|uniref:nitrogenase component 1 n=1 Tax=Methanolacinia petrolearia TaxID=54120 RepID=UPI003BAD961B
MFRHYCSYSKEAAAIKIAVYGKGRIGKSTISANISAALSLNGNRILQVGCDPKHDSTRLLLGGRVPETVLDYIRGVAPEQRSLDDIVFCGFGNVACVEAGGPEPGVGCAGRGIITTLGLLESLGLGRIDFDYEIYDVLGDVVCGGFAVPIRKEYAETIYLVTSGEFMAIYAANNILRGIKNFGDSPERVAGIIYNSRNLKDEDERIRAFAEAVKLPVVARIPRSDLFASAEKEGKTVIEAYPDSQEAEIFREIATDISGIRPAGGGRLHGALPLDDETLEAVVLGVRKKDIHKKRKHQKSEPAKATTQNASPTPSSALCPFRPGEKSTDVSDKKTDASVNSRTMYPLHGCAFAGAACVTAQIMDAYTILHGPKSCAHMMWGIIENSLLRMNRLYDFSTDFDITKRTGTTNMDDEDFIFGGEAKLRAEIGKAIDNGWKHIFIITACPPGIIGDDTSLVAEEMMKQHPGTTIEPIPADGNIDGDFSQGYIRAFGIIARYIDRSGGVRKENSVNIIGEKSLATNEEYDFGSIKYLLDAIGISVNTRFITRTDIASIRNLDNACMNLPAHGDFTSAMICEIVAGNSSLPFLNMPFPTGFGETSAWLTKIAEFFGKTQKAEELIESEEKIYRKKISGLKVSTKGKKLLVSTYSRNIDWIIELACDLGMEIVRIGLMHSPEKEPLRTRYEDLPVRDDYDPEIRREEIGLFSPDLVLLDRPAPGQGEYVRYDTIPYSAGFGFQAGLFWAERWSRVMKLPPAEEWRYDGEDVC